MTSCDVNDFVAATPISGPGVHVNSTVAFARDRARDVVANPECAKAFAPAFAQRTERVRSFAALADREDQRLRSHRRIAMAKLARVFDFGRDVRQSLDQIFADSAGMQRSAATGENDASDIAQLRRRHVQAAELGGAFLSVKTAAHRVAHGVWLLKDFLEHVVGVITLLDVFGREFDFADGMLRAVSGERSDLEFVRPHRDDIEVVQVNRVASVSDNRAHIAGQKIFVVADTEHERTSTSRADHEIRHIGMNQRDAICADHLSKRRANSIK